jgi:hypothetical protein
MFLVSSSQIWLPVIIGMLKVHAIPFVIDSFAVRRIAKIIAYGMNYSWRVSPMSEHLVL